MHWISREHPKIDRLACPWLILRFIDPVADILFVPVAGVSPMAERTGDIPLDVPGVKYTHYGTEFTFDYFLKKYPLTDPALQALAKTDYCWRSQASAVASSSNHRYKG